MRNRVRNISNAMHELLDLVEHTIDRLCEHVQFISPFVRWQTAGQVSLDDGRAVWLMPCTSERSTGESAFHQPAKQQNRHRGACEPIPEKNFQFLEARYFAADQKMVSARQCRCTTTTCINEPSRSIESSCMPGESETSGGQAAKLPASLDSDASANNMILSGTNGMSRYRLTAAMRPWRPAC